jgi:hypothetical protein
MRLRSIATVVALILAGMVMGGVSGARPFDGGTASVACGDGTVTVTPAKMWPPNHKMKDVTLTYDETSADDGDATGLTVTSISNEEEGTEKGSTLRHGPDDVGEGFTDSGIDTTPSDPATVVIQLRKERLAKPKDGRTYTIEVECTDGGAVSGGEATTDTATITVFVPHSRGKA